MNVPNPSSNEPTISYEASIGSPQASSDQSIELVRLCVQRAKQGNQDAYGELIEPLRLKLERTVAMLIGDWDEGQSIVQESILRGWAQIKTFHDEGNLYAWLRGIAVNLSKQHLDKRKRHARLCDPVLLSETESAGNANRGMLSQLLTKEMNAKLWLAVSQLPEAYREAFTLHYVEELDYAEISELTNVSAGTLRARALRARNLLKGSLGNIVDTWMRGSERSDN